MHTDDKVWAHIGKTMHAVNAEHGRMNCLLIDLKRKPSPQLDCVRGMLDALDECSRKLGECREAFRKHIRDQQ